MSKELIARADAVRAKHKLLESMPGTGFHDNDRNPSRPEVFAAPHKNGLPRASEHLVPFFDHHDDEVVHFVGDDADKATSALNSWLKKNHKADVSSMPGTERKLVLKIIPRLLASVRTPGLLTIRLSDWNDVLHALYAEGIGLSGLSVDPDQST